MERYSRRAVLGGAGAVFAGALAGCSTGASAGSDATETSEPLVLQTLDVGGSPGGPVPVRDAGVVTVLDFFATWCAPCVPQMDELRSVHAEFPDVHLLSVTTEQDQTAVRSFWREHEGTWPVALDPDLRATERYGATRVPTLVVLTPDGSEQTRHVGLIAAEDIADAIEAARQ